MGAMGAIAPTAKKLWGRCLPSRPNRNCVMSPLYTAKRYNKNYECVIMKLKKCAAFSLKMDQKRPDPLEEFTVLPQTHYLDLNGRGKTREGKGKRKKGREREEGVTREEQVGREGERGIGERGQEWKGKRKAENLAPRSFLVVGAYAPKCMIVMTFVLKCHKNGEIQLSNDSDAI